VASGIFATLGGNRGARRLHAGNLDGFRPSLNQSRFRAISPLCRSGAAERGAVFRNVAPGSGPCGGHVDIVTRGAGFERALRDGDDVFAIERGD
jgi:hypothetical protein